MTDNDRELIQAVIDDGQWYEDEGITLGESDTITNVIRAKSALTRLLERDKALDQLSLPCDVKLMPAMVIKQGCSLRTLLVALQRRDKHENTQSDKWDMKAISALLQGDVE